MDRVHFITPFVRSEAGLRYLIEKGRCSIGDLNSIALLATDSADYFELANYLH